MIEIASVLNGFYIALLFLAVLTVVVFIHELGHFLVARWCGVRIEAFSIGFGREIWGFSDRHGTRWKLAWIPLGGYVKFVDDENGASVPSRAAFEKMTPEQRAGAFQSKPLGQKALVVAAGPAFNIISAILILWGTYWLIGSYSTKAIVDDVVAGSAAARAGLQSGDRITAIDGTTIAKFSDLQRIVSQSAGKPLEFAIERRGRNLSFNITPELREITDPLCNKVMMGAIGIRRDAPPVINTVKAGSGAAKAGLKPGDRVLEVAGKPITFTSELRTAIDGSAGKPLALKVDRAGSLHAVTVTPEPRKPREPQCNKDKEASLVGAIDATIGTEHWEHQRFGLLQAFREGLTETYYISHQIITSIPKLPAAMAKSLTGQRQSELGGPIAIAEMTAQASSTGPTGLLGWIAVFSIMLGIMNLLPIPVLDGGHLMLYAIEAVRGKPLAERQQEWIFKLGLAMLATMMFAAVFGDIMRKLG